jgi:hypothetical protein
VTPTSSITPIPRETLPAACGTVSFGQPGTQYAHQGDQIIAQGVAILCGEIIFGQGPPESVRVPEALIDLDTGATKSSRSDLEYEVSAGSMIFADLAPINGAWLKPLDKVEPGYEGCLNVLDDFSNFDHVEFFRGQYICVLTNDGHMSQVKVESGMPLGPYVLAVQLSFITWRDLVPTPSRMP